VKVLALRDLGSRIHENLQNTQQRNQDFEIEISLVRRSTKNRIELFGFADKIHCSHFLVYMFNCVSYPSTSLDTLLGLQDVEARRISRQTAHGSVKVASSKQRRLYPQKIPLVHISVIT